MVLVIHRGGSLAALLVVSAVGYALAREQSAFRALCSVGTYMGIRTV